VSCALRALKTPVRKRKSNNLLIFIEKCGASYSKTLAKKSCTKEEVPLLEEVASMHEKSY
jgi:hypothetical protein